MYRSALALLPFLWCAPLHAECPTPPELVDSTVRIFRSIGPPGMPMETWVYASGWFLSQDEIVTAQHVVVDMKIPWDQWAEVELTQTHAGGRAPPQTEKVPVMVERVVETDSRENLYVLKLQHPFGTPIISKIRSTLPKIGDSLVGIGYTEGVLALATGRFWGTGTSETAPDSIGFALIEMADGVDRLALSHGASGGPVFDCDKVVGVISAMKTTSVLHLVDPLHLEVAQISTPPGEWNLVMVPTAALNTKK